MTSATAADRQVCLERLVARIDVHGAKVDIAVVAAALVNDQGLGSSDEAVVISAPATQVCRGDDVRLPMGDLDPAANRDERLIALVAEARRAGNALLDIGGASLAVVAARIWSGFPG